MPKDSWLGPVGPDATGCSQIRGKERPGGPSHNTPPQPFSLKTLAKACSLCLRLPLHAIGFHGSLSFGRIAFALHEAED